MAWLPIPDLYSSKRVSEVYLERAGMVAAAAEEHAAKHRIQPAARDKVRIAVFGIDMQVAFCTPGASLFVPGAVEDCQRAIEWIYRNLDRLTGLHFSLDTHRVFQIFHPAWWVDREGRHPAPFTPIFHEEVRAGRWLPTSHPEESLEYTRKLEATGKYVLTIWPYHAMLGGVSHALVPALMEAAIFHAAARECQTHFETKGTSPLTESYSVLSAEVSELGGQVVGGFNAPLFQLLMGFDRVYVFGEAKSHCVLATLEDIRERIQATDPSLAGKVYLLEDAMSPVPPPPIEPLPPGLDFPRVAERGFEELRQAGMRLVKTGDPI